MSKIVTIIIYKSEVVYDVQNKTHLTARSRQTGDNVESTSNMQVNDDGPEINQVMRSIGSAYDKLLTKLSPYISEIAEQKYSKCPCDTAHTELSADNGLMPVSGNELRVEFVMPDNFNESFLGAARAAMHEYLVNRVLGEWFALTSPTNAAFYFSQSESNFQDVKSCLDRRIKPLKRKLSVF